MSGVPVVGLDPTVPGGRFRFSVGHEHGHLMFHDRRHDCVESEANHLASALLFLRDNFDAATIDKPKLTDFVERKGIWGMSAATIVYSAHELGYIDDARYRALQIQMSKWRRNEPGRFDPAVGTLFPRLIELNGGTQRVAKKLGVNPKHLGAVVNWSHLRVV